MTLLLLQIMLVFVQLLGTDDAFPPAVLFVFEDKRYIFNVHEGFQRYCNETKVKLQKSTNIFLSSLLPHSIGGLVGLMLTVADAGHAGVDLFGPPNLRAFLFAARCP